MSDIQTAALAPDFTARDSKGKNIRLADFKGKKNIVLVFNRSFQ